MIRTSFFSLFKPVAECCHYNGPADGVPIFASLPGLFHGISDGIAGEKKVNGLLQDPDRLIAFIVFFGFPIPDKCCIELSAYLLVVAIEDSFVSVKSDRGDGLIVCIVAEGNVTYQYIFLCVD